MRVTRKIWVQSVDCDFDALRGASALVKFAVAQGLGPAGTCSLRLGYDEGLALSNTMKHDAAGEITIEFKPDRRALEKEIDDMEKRLGEMRRLLAVP